MQRKIKFRAWDKQNKSMEEVELLGDEVLRIKHAEWEDREDFEVMQYTGLKDKNGKEIYEGDIVEGGYLNPLTNRFLSKKYVIEYNEGGFCGRLIGHSPYGDTRLEFIEGEVIGNIYEDGGLVESERTKGNQIHK